MVGTVASRAWPQYVSVISMGHVLHGYSSLSRKIGLIGPEMKEGEKWQESLSGILPKRGGMEACTIRKLCGWGLDAGKREDVRGAALIVTAYVAATTEEMILKMVGKDVWIQDEMIECQLPYRKGKSPARPRLMMSGSTILHQGQGPIELLRKWLLLRDRLVLPDGFWKLWIANINDGALRAQEVTKILRTVLLRLNITAPFEYNYSSHSSRIGESNALQMSGFHDPVLVRYVWSTGYFLQEYFYESHKASVYQTWIFGKLL